MSRHVNTLSIRAAWRAASSPLFGPPRAPHAGSSISNIHPTITPYHSRQRNLHTTLSRHAPSRPQATRPSSASTNQTKPSNPIGSTNQHIPYRTVQLVSDTDNSLGTPTQLSSILRTFDRKTHVLRLVSTDPPVVKLIEISAEKEKQRHTEARTKLSRLTSIENKEFQISWSSAEGDLKHKAMTAKGVLEGGDRATLIFASKASGGGGGGGGAGGSGNGDKLKSEQKQMVINVFESILSGVGTKWREDEVRKGAYVQHWGPEKKVRDELRTKLHDEKVGRKREKEELKEARRKKDKEREKRAQEKREAALAAASAAAAAAAAPGPPPSTTTGSA